MISKDRAWINSMEWCKKYCGCHQKPERSFFIKGYQFPLCARCTGIALGHITAFILAPFHTFQYKIAVLMIPLIADGAVQYATSYESNNLRRAASGFLYGLSFTSIVIRLIKPAFRQKNKYAV